MNFHISKLILMICALSFMGLRCMDDMTCKELKGHTEKINAIAISGNKVVTTDGWMAKVWDINTGACLRTFEFSPFCVSAIALSGDTLVIAKNCGEVITRNLATGKEGRVHRYPEQIKCITISGQKVAIGFQDGIVEVLDMDTKTSIEIDPQRSERFEAIAASGDKIFICFPSGYILIGNITGKYLRSVKSKSFKTLVVSDDKIIAQSGLTLDVLDVNNGRLLRQLFSKGSPIEVVAAAEDLIVAGLSDGSLTIWDMNANDPVCHLRDVYTRKITALAVSGDKIVVGFDNGTVKILQDSRGRQQSLALASALHPRLGEHSIASALPSFLVHEISQHVVTHRRPWRP